MHAVDSSRTFCAMEPLVTVSGMIQDPNMASRPVMTNTTVHMRKTLGTDIPWFLKRLAPLNASGKFAMEMAAKNVKLIEPSLVMKPSINASGMPSSNSPSHMEKATFLPAASASISSSSSSSITAPPRAAGADNVVAGIADAAEDRVAAPVTEESAEGRDTIAAVSAVDKAAEGRSFGQLAGSVDRAGWLLVGGCSGHPWVGQLPCGSRGCRAAASCAASANDGSNEAPLPPPVAALRQILSAEMCESLRDEPGVVRVLSDASSLRW
mmetsp:Transcript_79202/g.201555  ORF Transcript_79202/g.201555 Transcript_79202/m.201555 type:complete len:267 (-) Transcript_79202:576-1376(-)